MLQSDGVGVWVKVRTADAKLEEQSWKKREKEKVRRGKGGESMSHKEMRGEHMY